MNLETRLDERMWSAIRTSYESRNFTGAILDSIYFLGDLIRQKTGLSSDGVTLVGKAFGGKNPKLKVNKLQSESEKNIQKGVEQILRGIYQSIRNPRSHEKYADSAQDAQAIIAFMDFLLRIIDQSKAPFTKSEFLKRVFDPDFVEKDRYAELLVTEIPPKQRLEVFIDVYREKESAKEEKLQYFVKALIGTLTPDDVAAAQEIISEELKHTDSQNAIRLVLRFFPPDWWPKYDEAARLRAEDMLIESVKDGRYSKATGRSEEGALGTWAANVIRHFELKKELASVLQRKLVSSDLAAQDYVFYRFFKYFPHLLPEPTPVLKSVILGGLKRGDARFYNAVASLSEEWFPGWREPFQAAYDAFQEKEQVRDVSDDEVPF